MTASPQLENGYIPIANELAEAFYRINLSAYEWRLLWFIMRKTYGFHKSTDAISLTQFATGTGISTANVIHTLARLKGRNLIVKSKDFHITEYGLNKHYDHWDSTEIDTVELDSVNSDSVETNSVNSNNKTASIQTVTKDIKILTTAATVVELDSVNSDSVETNSVNSNNKTASIQTVTKDNKRKTAATVDVLTIKNIFLSFKNESRYAGIDFDNEFSKMCEWYHGENKKVSNPKLACHNWLDHTLEIMSKNNGHSKQPAPTSKYHYVDETAEDENDN